MKSTQEEKFIEEYRRGKKKSEFWGREYDPLALEVKFSEEISNDNLNRLLGRKSTDFAMSDIIYLSTKDDGEKEFLLSKFSKSSAGKKQNTGKTSKSKKAKKHSDKKIEKRKKKTMKIFNEQLAVLLEEKEINQGALMAELMRNAERICVYEKKLMLYNNAMGCFNICDKDDFAVRLNSFFNKDVRLKLKSSEYSEAYRQVLMCEDLKFEDGFFENQPFVNCLNGIVDVLTGELLPHDPKYYFKHCINANFTPGTECPHYMEYIYHLFDGDEELIQLLQVVQGYLCSHYNNAKTAFLVYGEPHTGKSVFNNIMERIIGKNLVTHADLSYLCRQEYAASLAGKLLNVAPDLKNTPLRDVGFFKSLVSHDDTISTRALYSNPGEVRGETKMLFTSNHLIEFENTVGENDVHAVFNRLLYLPVQCKPIDESEENKHLSKELFEERDAIFTWGIEGLRKYIESGERFPKSVLSEQIKQLNIAKYCPEKIFFDDFLESEEKKSVSVSVVKELFAKFCSDIAIKRSKKSITQYIENVKGVEKTKRRINKEGDVCNTEKLIHVYAGIRLKNTY